MSTFYVSEIRVTRTVMQGQASVTNEATIYFSDQQANCEAEDIAATILATTWALTTSREPNTPSQS